MRSLLIRMPLVTSLVGCWLLIAAAQTPEPRWPDFDAETVSGRTVRLPDLLTSTRTVVLIAYSEEQQQDIDRWMIALAVRTRGIAWLQVAVLGKINPFFQNLILSGLRRALPDKADRERVAVTFVEGDRFRRSMGLGGEGRAIHVLVVERSGTVSLSLDGAYTPEKASQLLAALSAP